MKFCKTCKQEKPSDQFYRDNSRKDGLGFYCKACFTPRVAAHIKARPERHAIYVSRWAKRNKAARNAQKNRWRKKNAPKMRAEEARRRAAEYQATPLWANRFFIEEIYDLASRKTKLLCTPWQVDHIVPLRGKLVSGLHVENNLQVIPKPVNLVKGNRYWPDMPEQIQ